MKQPLITLLFVAFTMMGYSQIPTKEVNEYIAEQIKGKQSAESIQKLEKFSLADILQAYSKLVYDSTANIRSIAYQLVYTMAIHKLSDPALPKAVNFLIAGCRDKDGGVTYTNMNYLTYFPNIAFDVEARIKLTQLAKEGTQHYPLLIRITGLANITDLMYDYSEMLRLKTYKDKNTHWALCLALARLGNAEQAAFCLNLVKSLTVSDDLVYEMLPDLAYIRTKEAFDYMLDIILSNDKNCLSSNPNSEAKIICAYRVIKLVAPYIVDFPVKLDIGGDIITTDYKIMLTTVREWIHANKTSYTLKTQLY